MIKGRYLATAMLLIGSCICGGLESLYAQAPQRTLPNPDNITREVTYDEDDDTYSVGYKLGGEYLQVPDVMTPDEYTRMPMQRSLQSFYREKYADEVKAQGDNKFDLPTCSLTWGPPRRYSARAAYR